MTHEIKTRPILMNGAMVRATLAGAKTQTRRVVSPQPPSGHVWIGWCASSLHRTDEEKSVWALDDSSQLHNAHRVRCPHGRPGDRLYVRETFGYMSPDEHQRPHSECNIEYRADLAPGCTDRPGNWPVGECADDPERPRWRPSLHMPQSASRITLEITGVRVERLQDISTEDIIAEGLSTTLRGYDAECDLRDQWRKLWESTGGDWDSNPWLWVINFAKVKA